MKSKKAQTGAIVGTILVVLFIVAVIVVIVIAVQKGKNPTNQDIDKNPMKFFLKAKDEVSGEFLNTKYGVYSDNKTLISQGNLLEDSLTEINVPRQTLEVYAYNDDYYFRKAFKMFSPNELIQNESKMTIDLLKIGNINVKHTGKLNEANNLIRLNLTSSGWYYKTKLCISWTPGIISVNKPNDYLICDKGPWLNYSEYNPQKKEYVYYDNNYSRCGEDWLERCEFTSTNKCRVLNTLTPYRYMGLVDTCIYLGKSLNNISMEVPLEIRTEGLNPLDQITIYIMDQDRRWNPQEQMFTWMTEDFEENNIGNPEDLVYKINYEN